jgi:hypothetical protein
MDYKSRILVKEAMRQSAAATIPKVNQTATPDMIWTNLVHHISILIELKQILKISKLILSLPCYLCFLSPKPCCVLFVRWQY